LYEIQVVPVKALDLIDEDVVALLAPLHVGVGGHEFSLVDVGSLEFVVSLLLLQLIQQGNPESMPLVIQQEFKAGESPFLSTDVEAGLAVLVLVIRVGPPVTQVKYKVLVVVVPNGLSRGNDNQTLHRIGQS